MRKRPLCAICIFFLAIQLGRVIFSETGGEIPSALERLARDTEKVSIKGTVHRIEEKEKVTAVFLKDNILSAAGQNLNESEILVYISKNNGKQSESIRIGNLLRISGIPEILESARNPGNFDQKAYYRIRGIRLLVMAETICTVSDDTYPVRQFLWELRCVWKEILIRQLGSYYGETMSAVLLGDKSGLDDEMKSAYQKCGISHLLAISGLHMTFLGMGIYKLLRRAGAGFGLSGAAGAVLLIFYCLMTGAGVSSVRALIMFAVKIGAEITGRDYDLPTGLALSAAVQCSDQPLYLTDASFLLSYGAILGIVLLVPVFSDMSAMKNESKTGRSICRQIRNSFCASTAVSIFLAGPLLWFYFEIPLYSVLLNLIVIPAMPAAMGAGIAGSLITPVAESAGAAVLQICRAVLAGYDAVCTFAGGLPYARIVTGRPQIYWIVLYYTVVGAVLFFYRSLKSRQDEEKMPGGQRRIMHRIPGVILLLFSILMIFVCRTESGNRNGVQVTVLDVGQGDGIYVGASSFHCLIDGGSSDVSMVGKFRLEPYFLSQGIDCLDYVFVTHGDEDHISGIREILMNQKLGVKIRTLVFPPEEYHDEKLKELEKTAAEYGTCTAVMEPGNRIASERTGKADRGELILTCVGPERGTGMEPGNDASLVLQLSYGKFKMLFAGDVEQTGEKYLFESERLEKCDVLKAAHHGSENSGSEEFLNAVSPVCAVVSAGRDNRYGHPHSETVIRMKRAGCKVYSTQDNGAVTIRSDGGTMKIAGFLHCE